MTNPQALKAALSLALSALCMASEAAPTLSGRGVDDVRIGALATSIPSGRITETQEVVNGETGQRDTVLGVRLVQGITKVEIDQGRIWRMAVSHPGPATASGVQVGTRAALAAQRDDAVAEVGPGGWLVLVPRKRCGLAYRTNLELDTQQLQANWNNARLRQLPATVVVKEIVLFGCKP